MMVTKKTIRDIDLHNKKVIVRVDYNVPLDANGKVQDTTRILGTIPTLQYLLEHDAAIIVMSHLGRPKGKPDKKLSLLPVSKQLEKLLGQSVTFLEDCVGEKVKKEAASLKPKEILLLENLRFHKEEESNDLDFAKALATLGDVFVNDAFATAHRAHASTVGITQFLPSVAGFLLEKELNVLAKLLQSTQHPYLAILGGSKVSEKIGVIKNLIKKVDAILIGGAMAFTFLKAEGFGIGNSLMEEKYIPETKNLLNQFNDKIKLPVDVIAAPSIESPKPVQPIVLSREKDSLAGLQALDIGEKTIQSFSNFIKSMKPKIIFWNGPMGVFEIDAFSKGTFEIAKTLSHSAREGVNVVIGGGDSVAAVNKLGLALDMNHILTGGGASLEFLEGKVLPGIAALQDLNPVSCNP